MRNKDENKNEAIYQATIQLLNEIGFAEISMSKIAKRAGVSPSTIYVYFENKEDMLNKLYLKVKHKLSRAALSGIDDAMPLAAAFETALKNLMEFALNNKEDFLFLEQFANSPLIDKVYQEEGVELFKALFDLVEKGKSQHLLKQIDTTLLLAYCYFPIVELAKQHLKGTFVCTEDALQQIIRLSWDAVKA